MTTTKILWFGVLVKQQENLFMLKMQLKRSFLLRKNTINQDLFESMDDGLQALILAEGIHREKQVIIGVFRDTPKFAQALKDKGMVERPWPAGAVAKLKDASVSLVLPGWVKRTGGADSEAVKVFNENLADILGVRVLADGSIERF